MLKLNITERLKIVSCSMLKEERRVIKVVKI